MSSARNHKIRNRRTYHATKAAGISQTKSMNRYSGKSSGGGLFRRLFNRIFGE